MPVTATRIFATMNPISVGGGRSQLPRSIRCLFNEARLSPPSAPELAGITFDLFAPCMEADLIHKDTVTQLFQLHARVGRALEQRAIGKGGGVMAFNLRDLIKAGPK